MSDLVYSKYHDSEIAKAEDFNFTASATMGIISAILDGAFDDVVNSFVISGMEITQLPSPTMNVQIAPGLAFNRAENKLLHLYSAVSALVSPAHETLDRLDTVEARYLATDFNAETRAFKSPETGAITYNLVFTKTKISVDLKCVEGVAGSGVAPDAEAGWMKLAEVEVLAGATQIINANIRNIDAEEDGSANSAWTAETTAAFHLGSIESIKNTLYSHIRNNITSLNTVHGIRQGAGNSFDSDLLDGQHGSFYRDTANLDAGEYKITRSLIPGTDQYQLNILRADYDQAVVKIGPKSDWPDEDVLSYPKEATLTLYASRVRWYDLYVDISLNRLADPDYPKFVTFMRGDGIRVPEWKIQYRKDSGAYTDLLSCDPEGDGRFYSHRGSFSCKMSEIGAIDGLSAVNSSGDYYVDGSVSGLPVAESGVIHHFQNPYSTDNASQEYQSFADPTNHFKRSKVSGTWTSWRKIVINKNVKGTFSISDLGSENTGLTKALTLSADGLGKAWIGVDSDIDVLELTAGKLKVNGNAEASQLISVVAEGTAPLSVVSTTVVPNLNADFLDGHHVADFVLFSGLGNGWSAALAYEYKYRASLNEIVAAGTSRNTYSTSYVKLKEIRIDRAGIVKVSFTLYPDSGGSSRTAYGRIYVNGSAVGTERTNNSYPSSESTYTQDITVAAGDLIQLYAKTSNASYYAQVSAFRILASPSGLAINVD